MSRFFRDAWGTFGSRIRELFYDPMGRYVKNGMMYQGAIGGHSDHVHLALAKGGIVTKPTMALIGESGPEAVVPLGAGGAMRPTQINLNVDGATLASVLFDPLRNKVVQHRRSGGRF